jgi:ATP-dependent RNA helicase DeaD
VNDLSHVFHYSMPDEQQYYTHRSGRTARAGKKGTSILFISNRDKKKVRYLEQDLGIQLEARGIPSSSEIKEIRLEKWCVDILGQHPKGKLDPEMVAKVHILFGALSKEELINKLIAKELESLDHAQTDHPAQNFHHVQQQHRSRRSSHTQGNFKKRRGRSDSHKSKRAGSYKRR